MTSPEPAPVPPVIHIVFVEENPTDADLVLRHLERAGMGGDLRRVVSEAELARAILDFAPDVILTDHALPELTARDTLRITQRDAPQTPVIVVTGSLDDETAAGYIKAGAADYVLRTNLSRLPSAISRALDLRRAREQDVRSQELLRQSEERYRTLLEGVHDVVFALGPDGMITALSPAFETMTGWVPHRWLGKPLEQLVHSDDVPLVFELIGRVLRGESRPTNRFRIRTSQGGYCVAEVAATPELRDGRTVGILGVARDVTERLNLEQQLRQAQKMEAVGRLAGGVAHDFNNILTAITGYADLLLDDLAASDPRRQDVDEIRKASARAAGLTRQLLAFSRQQVMQVQSLDLNALILETVQMLGRLLGEDVQVVSSLAADLGAVKADPGQLEQVIMNLAVNARDAMAQGGKLTFETANVELDELYSREHFPAGPGSYVMLAMSDTGVGMTEETQAHLFEPFFTTKEKGKGTGLGLATVYGIVKQTGGFIWVYTELGHGTTFKIYLPRATESPQPRWHTAPVGPADGTETVLVAEDEAAVRGVARQALSRHGYTVLEAPSAEAALDVASRHSGKIDLLLTDVVMPGMSGRDLARRLADARPGLRVIYMSGYTEDTITRHGILEPGLVYVQKPFSPEALARRVREVLDGT